MSLQIAQVVVFTICVISGMFLVVIVPLYGLFHCCTAQHLRGKERLVWVALILVMNVVSAVPYAVFRAPEGAFRRLTLHMVSVISLGLFCLVYLEPERFPLVPSEGVCPIIPALRNVIPTMRDFISALPNLVGK